MKETLFWGLFSTGASDHCRMTLLKGEHGLQELYNWLLVMRDEIELKENRPAIIKDMKYITRDVIETKES